MCIYALVLCIYRMCLAVTGSAREQPLVVDLVGGGQVARCDHHHFLSCPIISYTRESVRPMEFCVDGLALIQARTEGESAPATCTMPSVEMSENSVSIISCTPISCEQSQQTIRFANEHEQ